MAEDWCKPSRIQNKSGILLEIHASPGASRTAIKGTHGSRLKITVKAPPVEGAANLAILDFLSKCLKIPKMRIHLIRGESSRQKTYFIESASLTEIRTMLGPP